MLFHSWSFALFFATFYSVFLILRRTRLRIPWLLLASYAFYAAWNPIFLALIAGSTAIDYIAGLGIASGRGRRAWLGLSIAADLGVLSFFKYGAFVAESLTGLFARLGIPYAIPAPGIVITAGISFYVFRSLTYTIDLYRGEVEVERNILRYATFVAFFPALMAGPIERAKSLLPQLRETPRIRAQDIADGLSLFAAGIFKKVALADALALYVGSIYAAPGSHEAPALIAATFAFAWQIYFDFSGYTDMARGVARLIGIRLMLNFDNPYLSAGLGEFWRRWHISLSTWFRDYVYIPLGGSRRGSVRTEINMAAAMVLSGLWHGAAWTFVLWGAIHAAGRALTRRLEATSVWRDRVPKIAKQLFVFAIVSFAWIFFRAETIADAWLIIGRIFSFGWEDPRFPILAFGAIVSVWLYQIVYESRLAWVLRLAPLRIGLVAGMVLYVALFAASRGQGFIYLQF